MTPREVAVQAELTDTRAWLDEYAAAPAPVGAALGLQVREAGALAMLRSHIPFSHFNMVLTLGCPAPVNEAAFAAIETFYGSARHWVLVNDHSQPPNLAARLRARGYGSDGSWDRVVLRGGVQPARWARHAEGCELVDAGNAEEWITFIRACYGMPPPVGHWLQALVARPRWIHALCRDGGHAGAKVVMVRSA